MRQYSLIKNNSEKRSSAVKEKILSIAFLVSLVMFLSSSVRTFKRLRNIDEEADIKERELVELRDREAQLKSKYEEITSDDYIEKQLRNQLNMTKENELILILPPDEILVKLVPKDEIINEDNTVPNWRKWAEIFFQKSSF